MSTSENNMNAGLLAGCASESTAWKMLSDISSELKSIHSEGGSYGKVCLSNIAFDESGNFSLVRAGYLSAEGNKSSDIWGLGASVYELLMGVPVFGGRGEKVQKDTTPVPVFRKDKYDDSLGEIVVKCLSFNAESRPDADAVRREAEEWLCKAESGKKGRTPKSEIKHRHHDILKFWPEEMI